MDEKDDKSKPNTYVLWNFTERRYDELHEPCSDCTPYIPIEGRGLYWALRGQGKAPQEAAATVLRAMTGDRG